MVLGALIALFKDDLKALLAFSTVSHLGLLTMLLGFGTQAAAVAAVFHIINHLTFKAALFMTAGIVDHETHTRDIKRLGGLRHLMPVTFLIGTVAALSMAGIPLFNGFLSKEMMLEEASHTYWAGSTGRCPSSPRSARSCLWPTPSASSPTSSSARCATTTRTSPMTRPSACGPRRRCWPCLVIVIGVAPFLAEGIVTAAANAVTGADLHPHLKIWHGVTPALWMSVIAIVGGAVLLLLHRPLDKAWIAAPRPEAKAIFDRLVTALVAMTRAITEITHNGAISRYLAIFTVAALALGWIAWSGSGLSAPTA
jgi:multicomponent K+:H+ antiporter subunit A